jgi:K+-sensing histidine kinase KdpD
VTKSAKHVTIKIEDAGQGLPSEFYKAEFSGFQRFDPKHSKTSGGTGLGMNIMGSIAEHLGGEVKLSKSKSLGGLCITLKLPR